MILQLAMAVIFNSEICWAAQLVFPLPLILSYCLCIQVLLSIMSHIHHGWLFMCPPCHQSNMSCVQHLCFFWRGHSIGSLCLFTLAI